MLDDQRHQCGCRHALGEGLFVLVLVVPLLVERVQDAHDVVIHAVIDVQPQLGGQEARRERQKNVVRVEELEMGIGGLRIISNVLDGLCFLDRHAPGGPRKSFVRDHDNIVAFGNLVFPQSHRLPVDYVLVGMRQRLGSDDKMGFEFLQKDAEFIVVILWIAVTLRELHDNVIREVLVRQQYRSAFHRDPIVWSRKGHVVECRLG